MTDRRRCSCGKQEVADWGVCVDCFRDFMHESVEKAMEDGDD